MINEFLVLFKMEVIKKVSVIIISFFVSVFRVFNEENDGNLSMREWIMGLSKIKGTPKEQIDCK